MYAFTINIVDSSIDAKICKSQDNSPSAGKCKQGDSSSSTKLSGAFGGAASTSTAKVDAHTSKTIATETATLHGKGTLRTLARPYSFNEAVTFQHTGQSRTLAQGFLSILRHFFQ